MELQEVKIALKEVVKPDYEWPKIPLGWQLEFIAYSDKDVDMALFASVKNKKWIFNSKEGAALSSAKEKFAKLEAKYHDEQFGAQEEEEKTLTEELDSLLMGDFKFKILRDEICGRKEFWNCPVTLKYEGENGDSKELLLEVACRIDGNESGEQEVIIDCITCENGYISVNNHYLEMLVKDNLKWLFDNENWVFCTEA